MKIPNLKRIKVASNAELLAWLSRQAPTDESIMQVTNVTPTSPKHISHDQVHQALALHGRPSGPKIYAQQVADRPCDQPKG